MYKQLLLSVLFLILQNNILFSQTENYLVRVSLGYGSYGMNTLESLQDELVNEFSLIAPSVIAVESFPAHWNYQISFSRKLNAGLKIGLFIGYGSTGGRIHYSDYSGEIKSDQIVTFKSFGGLVEFLLGKTESLNFVISLQTGVLFSDLTLTNSFSIYSETETAEIEFESTGIGFEPTFGIEFPLLPLLFRLDLGFQISMNSTFNLKGEPDALLIIGTKEITPNFLGYRVGLSVGFVF